MDVLTWLFLIKTLFSAHWTISLHSLCLRSAHLFYSCSYCESKQIRASAKYLNCEQLQKQETLLMCRLELCLNSGAASKGWTCHSCVTVAAPFQMFLPNAAEKCSLLSLNLGDPTDGSFAAQPIPECISRQPAAAMEDLVPGYAVVIFIVVLLI